MARVLVRFDGGDVPIVTGDVPASDQTPISNPTPTGETTNQAFIVDEGDYCYGLDCAVPYTPLWQVVQAVDGEESVIDFKRTGP